jgi:hypothetical protein
MFSAADLPCTNPALGSLSFHRSINADVLAIWIFVLYFADINKPCLGRASRSSGLESSWRVFALVLAHDYVPCDVVGSDVHRNRVAVRESFGISATISIARRCFRDTWNAGFNQNGGVALCADSAHKTGCQSPQWRH